MSSSSFGSLVQKAQEGGASFDTVPEGNYLAKVIESEFKHSSAGKPQIKTRWEIIQGPHAGYKGIWNYFTLTIENPNAVQIFFHQLKALGITQDFLDALSDLDNETAVKHIANALKDRVAQLKLKVDTEWNNNKVDRINPAPAEFGGGAAAGVVPASPFGNAAPPAAPAAPARPF